MRRWVQTKVMAVAVSKRGSYLKPQHGRVRRRSTARSTLSGSSVKTYRKASRHRKKPKIISYEGKSHSNTFKSNNSVLKKTKTKNTHLKMTY